MVKQALYVAAVVLLVIAGAFAWDYASFLRSRSVRAQSEGAATTAELRAQLDEVLSRIGNEATQLAERLGRDLGPEDVQRIVRQGALAIPELQGVTACYEPFAFDPDRRLYCPYYDKGTQRWIYVEDSYDYTVEDDPGTAWYVDVRKHGARWVEPYYARAGKDWYVDYGVPFHYGSGPKKGEVRGTITMSFVVRGFKELVHGMALGRTGYGIITSPKGKFLAHPLDGHVGTATLSEVRPNVPEPLGEAFAAMERGESGQIVFHDVEHDDEGLFFYDRIPSSGWGLGVMFFKDDLLNDRHTLDQYTIQLSFVISLVLVCLLATWFARDYLDPIEIGALSLLGSLLLLGNIALVGYLRHSAERTLEPDESPPVVDLDSIDRFVARLHQVADERRDQKLIPVPTGLYVERMEFVDGYNVNLSGRLWQKYPVEIVDKVEPGFRFTQTSPFAEAANIILASRERIAGKEGEQQYVLVAWDFRVTLLMNFDYSEYPLDKRHIDIAIVPMHRRDNLMFVPDLSSYTSTAPSDRIGLSPRVAVPGSQVVASYYSFSIEGYPTDFGVGNKGQFEAVPILRFNVDMRRRLLNEFVTYLIPIIVVLLMMFMLILACRKTNNRQGIIESMAAFFFVLTFSHIDLRSATLSPDLMYMEHFYFVTYTMIVLSTFNLISYTGERPSVFDRNHNRAYKALFFPVFFTLIFAGTVWRFY